MTGRYTSQFPKIGPITPLFFIPTAITIGAFVVAPSSTAFFAYLTIAVLVGEIVVKITKTHSLGALMRRIISSLLMGLFGRGMKSTPVSWRRRHFPTIVITLFSSSLFIASPDVSAEFNVTDSLRWDRDLRAGSVGMTEDDAISVSCNQCPLKIGLRQLLPTDFNLLIDDSVFAGKEVSYSPGTPWGKILYDLAVENDLAVEIHKHGNRVIVENSPSNRGTVDVVSLEQRKASFYDTKSWELIPGDSLHQSLERWAASEGWEIIYEVDDVAIDVPAVFDGNLIEAVTTLFASYRASGRFMRVQPQYSTANNTIRIAHEQQGAGQ